MPHISFPELESIVRDQQPQPRIIPQGVTEPPNLDNVPSEVLLGIIEQYLNITRAPNYVEPKSHLPRPRFLFEVSCTHGFQLQGDSEAGLSFLWLNKWFMATMLREIYNRSRLYIRAEVGAPIGSHCGSGCVGRWARILAAMPMCRAYLPELSIFLKISAGLRHFYPGNYLDFNSRASVDINHNLSAAFQRRIDMRLLSRVSNRWFPNRQALFLGLEITNVTAADMRDVCDLFHGPDAFASVTEVFTVGIRSHLVPSGTIFYDQHNFSREYRRMTRRAKAARKVGGNVFSGGGWTFKGSTSPWAWGGGNWLRTRTYRLDRTRIIS